MFRRLFTEHPESVGESYVEHFGVAARFGGIMIGGLGAIVHAVVPGLCTTTGSDTVARLHAEMVAKRRKKQAAQAQMKSVEYVI
jgi:predicted house-cleaning NTP pyrophosphatase (Maf/HAM1 superfamily)